MSCDLKPGEKGLPHYQGNILDVLGWGWDMAIFHPECTRLTNAANRWLYEDSSVSTVEERWAQREKDIEHFLLLKNAPIEKIAIENPEPHPYVIERVGVYQDKVQPHFFGTEETKGYCWWLKNLPPLMSTVLASRWVGRVWKEPPGPDRAERRSRMDENMARAIAKQWGNQ